MREDLAAPAQPPPHPTAAPTTPRGNIEMRRLGRRTLALPLTALAGACSGAGDAVPHEPAAAARSSQDEGGGAAAGGGGARAAADEPVAIRQLRERMVTRQIAARGVDDPAVLEAMRTVPRHAFVPSADLDDAYADGPLPIGHGQTISQPYIVAFMAQAAGIEPKDRVLEIGTGSGYGAAILSRIASQVYTMEIVPELTERARGVLETLGYDNVHPRTGNGWLGWPEHAPYDAIVVTAAPDEVPRALVEQLAVGGRLVVPVGEFTQSLRVLVKTEDGLEEKASMPVRFVPMVGEPDDDG